MKETHHSMPIRKCKCKKETTVTHDKTHANDNNITKYTLHACMIHSKTSWEITYAICYLKVFILKLFDLIFPSLSLAFLCFLVLTFPFFLHC